MPFLNQPIQGDDYYYLTGGMHAQIDPLHPTHGEYVFAGQMVSMRGHPHPPFNMWFLGGLLALFGDIEEVRFHAAYILFSLIAALSMWSLARRFSPVPLLATLLFLAVPPFVVNGNSLESDVPFLAFWMASVAFFVRAVDRRSSGLLALAVTAMIPAAMAAYQSVLLIPLLAGYLLLRDGRWRAGWLALATPAAAIGVWQLFERATGGALPAEVLAGHFESYGFQAIANKLDSAVALTVHSGWQLFPLLGLLAFGRLPKWLWAVILAATGAAAVALDPHPLFWFTFCAGLVTIASCVLALRKWGDKDQLFLAGWVALFFAAALVLFFAGSARYLLPMAAPVCLLASRRLRNRPPWLAAGFALQITLALALAVANYQHWDGYRGLVADLAGEFPERRVWVNSEMGLRYYAEALGGLALEQSQPVQPGDMVISSEVCYPIEFTTGGGVLTPLMNREIRSRLPFRLIGLDAKSAYSTVTLGYRPFDVVPGPIDRVRAEVVVERQPALSFLPMNAPEAENQIVSGIYKLEDGAWRWMAGRGVVLLKAPPVAARLAASVYIPDVAPAREVTLLAAGVEVARAAWAGPGSYTLTSEEPFEAAGDTVTVEILADAVFSPPGDHRELGLVLSSVGFRAP